MSDPSKLKAYLKTQFTMPPEPPLVVEKVSLTGTIMAVTRNDSGSVTADFFITECHSPEVEDLFARNPLLPIELKSALSRPNKKQFKQLENWRDTDTGVTVTLVRYAEYAGHHCISMGDGQSTVSLADPYIQQ